MLRPLAGVCLEQLVCGNGNYCVLGNLSDLCVLLGGSWFAVGWR